MSPSKILFYFCIACTSGIFLESFVKIPQLLLWGILLLAILGVAVSLINKRVSFVVGLCFLFFAIGVLRMQISEFNISHNWLKTLNGDGSMTLKGYVADGPDVRDTTQKIEVKIGESLVLVTTDKYPEYHYLDQVTLTGKLTEPEVFDDFNYQEYLLKDHIYSLMSFPKIEITGKEKSNLFSGLYSGILSLKEKMANAIDTDFNNPQRGLLQGIILGNNKNITQELRDELNVTGLRFLTAISGVHVIVISNILMALFLSLGFWRNKACWFSLIFIWAYIALTGFSASGIRAGIMGSIFIIAQALGRQNTSSRTITLAAVFMLLENPLLLRYDIGFQLSFIASMGIIYFKPLADVFLKHFLKDRLEKIRDIVSVTFTAQLFTLPIMMFNFHTISFIAPLANLLILPVFYWILISGFVFALAAMVVPSLGVILMLPCWLLTTYFIKVMDVFNQPWAAITTLQIHWIWPVLLYFLIAMATWALHKKYAHAFF